MIAVFAVWGSGPAAARTTATTGQQAVGEGCSGKMSGADFDTIFQCNNDAGGTKQTAPLVVGTVTAPPYPNTTCDASKAGMIQWTGSAFQGCDGSSWGEIQLGGGSSSTCTPAAFSFTNQTGVDPSSTITSNAVTLGGDDFTCVSIISCPSCTALYKNGSAVSKAGAAFLYGDSISVSQQSSLSLETTTSVDVVAGSNTTTWSVTTMADPCAGASPTLGAACHDGSVYAGLSPDGNVKMFTTPCDQGQSGTQGSCTGTRGSLKWGTYGVATGYTSTTDGDGNTAGLVANYSTYTDSQSTYGVPAAQYCADLTAHGHSDWYLPAKDELNVLYTNKTAIGGFNTDGTYYWSSSEYANAIAWIQRFSDGDQGTSTKYNASLVRCVRR